MSNKHHLPGYPHPGTPQSAPAPLHPIVQPAYVNQGPVASTPIYSAVAVPQTNEYVTPFDPVFIDHLSRHQGQHLVVVTTVGQIEGVLTGVAVDHIQLNVSEDRALHIRVAQIVYFEGLPIHYR